LTLFSAPQNT